MTIEKINGIGKTIGKYYIPMGMVTVDAGLLSQYFGYPLSYVTGLIPVDHAYTKWSFLYKMIGGASAFDMYIRINRGEPNDRKASYVFWNSDTESFPVASANTWYIKEVSISTLTKEHMYHFMINGPRTVAESYDIIFAGSWLHI